MGSRCCSRVPGARLHLDEAWTPRFAIAWCCGLAEEAQTRSSACETPDSNVAEGRATPKTVESFKAANATNCFASDRSRKYWRQRVFQGNPEPKGVSEK